MAKTDLTNQRQVFVEEYVHSVISGDWLIKVRVEAAFTSKLATSIKGRGLAGLTGRKHDLGEYLFFRAKKNNTCAQIRPTEIFRSWGNR